MRILIEKKMFLYTDISRKQIYVHEFVAVFKSPSSIDYRLCWTFLDIGIMTTISRNIVHKIQATSLTLDFFHVLSLDLERTWHWSEL